MTRDKKDEASLLDYLSEAFRFRWNLLLFLGAGAAAALSPAPDAFFPLVAAGELLYLAGLTSNSRFRAAIDAKVHSRKKAATRNQPQSRSERSLGAFLEELEANSRNRFLHLRQRCLEMQRIAHGVRGESNSSEADEVRAPALDRLLWVFLKLLRSSQAIQRFLATTDEDAIRQRLERLKERQAKVREQGDERMQRSLADDIVTTELRLDNYRKAEKNAEFLEVEINRIEGKIQALTEVMVSHQDPDYISSQVDSVAESMKHTEEAIRELNSITGLRDELEATPEILEAEIAPPEIAETQ